jgi:hypothetical protein
MEKWDTPDSAVLAAGRRGSDDEVAHLIDRIKRLVAQQRRLDGSPESERREANRREIDRLQDRLALAVKRELER